MSILLALDHASVAPEFVQRSTNSMVVPKNAEICLSDRLNETYITQAFFRTNDKSVR